jgi:hypothetical protein
VLARLLLSASLRFRERVAGYRQRGVATSTTHQFLSPPKLVPQAGYFNYFQRFFTMFLSEFVGWPLNYMDRRA